MHVRNFHFPRRVFEDLSGVDGGQPGGAPAPAPAAAAPAAPSPAPGAPAPSPAPAVSAPAAPAPQPGSLMARGAAAAPAGPAPAGSPAPADQPPAVAEKFLVKNEAGEVDWQASALKQAEAYSGLEKRMGAGEAPPKDADSYQLELPEGLTMDALKTDPLFAGFLKGAHAKGLNNGQVSYLLSEFQQRVQLMQDQAADPAVAEAELSKVWTTPQAMERGLTNCFRGAQAFADDADHAKRLDEKFGSDPDFIRLMAKVGAELGEDKLPGGGLTQVETDTLESLRRSDAYRDAKHPEHAAAVAKVSSLYKKLHPA